jgi:hypothetical protein
VGAEVGVSEGRGVFDGVKVIVGVGVTVGGTKVGVVLVKGKGVDDSIAVAVEVR